jgi:beta-galactosidase
VSLPDSSPADVPGLWLGVDYHPEDWPEERWPDDLKLMNEAGINVVRLAEHAWASLEPTPGTYAFDWLDSAIGLLGSVQIHTLLTIPTSAPPPWMIGRHARSRLEVDDGPTGIAPNPEARSTWCINSPEYRTGVASLVQRMAEHFGANPNVVGWQIHGGQSPVCQCRTCLQLFRAFLAGRAAAPEQHIRQDDASVTSQTDDCCEETRSPLTLCSRRLALDFGRFVTQNRLEFQKLQIDLLRPHLKLGTWISQPCAGWQSEHDPYILAEGIDRVLSDCSLGGKQDYRNRGAAYAHALGLKGQNFWLSNRPPPSMGTKPPGTVPAKDATQAQSWQAIAHGADGLVCWQWRPGPRAEEPYRADTLLDQSGQPRQLFEEIKLLGLEFSALSSCLVGSKPEKARVAILYSSDSRWSIEGNGEETPIDYVEYLEHWYRPLITRNVAVDIIRPDANLDQYKMVIAPALAVLDDRIVASLQQLVKHSGHLVLTLKTGIRDQHNSLFLARQPGPLSEIAGVEVEDCYALEEPVPVKANWFEGVSRHWAERLRIVDSRKAVKIARYGSYNGWLDDQIAITVCAQGTGLTYVVGANLDVAAQQAMVDHFVQNAGLQKIQTPPGIEVSVRVSPEGNQIYLVVNHERSPANVTLPVPTENPLTGQQVTGAFRLAPYGVAVLVKSQGPESPSGG